MGEQTKIQWTHHTANLWWGCTETNSGCDHCYARVLAKRVGKADAWDGVRYATKSVWNDLVKWQRAARAAGEIHRVFCGSMMDLFEKPLPVSDWQGEPLGITTGDLRDRLFREVIPACPDLEFQLLTKRPGNVLRYVPPEWFARWPANVISGTSVVNQETADTLIPQLLRVPGRRFLSMEPLLGPVDFRFGWLPGRTIDRCRYFDTVQSLESNGKVYSRAPHVDWVIVGGESGGNSRPCDLAWIRFIIYWCQAAGIPVLVKQLGAKPISDGQALLLDDAHGGDMTEWPEDLRVREFPAVATEAKS